MSSTRPSSSLEVDALTLFIFGGSAVCLLSVLLWRNKNTSIESTTFLTIHCDARLERKRTFLSKAGDEYGYRQSKKGFIDDWRQKEFPTLQPPLSEQEAPQTDTNEEYEIYLDHAGSALPPISQMEACLQSSKNILANPHSSGPAASRTLLGIQQAKSTILQHFQGTAGRFASVQLPDPCTDSHSGYEVVFTSGTTEALRILCDRFPFGEQSILLYSQNSHSSVLGMREVAISMGARFVCLPIEEIESMAEDDFQALRNEKKKPAMKSLLVFPAECNFGGYRPDCRKIIATARSAGWYTMLDVAKAASTGPISLRDWNPDFACVSYYKLFGSPTGVGSLIIKRTTMDLLVSQRTRRRYVGGGSFDLILAKQDGSAPSEHASLVSGTPNFRSILELRHGFDEIDNLGGMERIRLHTGTLARELSERLGNLHHCNGKPAIAQYGAHSDAGNHKKKGPIITMNILRDDGSVVGYNEVAKLAVLRKPAMQFRTGCFCNPGACQEALQLTDEEIIQNYKVAGHVCGDHIDILNGKPTGAIRISFGKDSIWEDLDEFVSFIDKTFVNKGPTIADETYIRSNQREEPAEVALTELYIFPIKSCGAQRVAHWNIDLRNGNLAYDREFALVDSVGSAMRLQNNPKMGFIAPRVDPDGQTLIVSAPGCGDLVIPLGFKISSDRVGCNDVSVCGNKCGGRLWGGRKASEWFSTYLGVECWLARYSETQSRENRNTAQAAGAGKEDTRTGFANDQPILMIAENAVGTLNEILLEQNQAPVGSKHFRPNMVIRWPGRQRNRAHLEDDWTRLYLKENGLAFTVKGDCARCAMVDYDPSTGKKGKTLRALANYRRRNGQITFGIFLKAMYWGGQDDPDEFIWINEGNRLICE